MGFWGALEAIWVCRTNLAEKDVEARFLILAFYLKIMAKTIEAIELLPTHYSQMGEARSLDQVTGVLGRNFFPFSFLIT